MYFSNISLTAFDLHGALLRIVRVEMEIHGARENQRQPACNNNQTPVSIQNTTVE
jgi:hypothetical protein